MIDDDFLTDIISIKKYKKRYYDFKEAFYNIVNSNIIKPALIYDSKLDNEQNREYNINTFFYTNIKTNKVPFIFASNENFWVSYDILWNRIEECNNFRYNGYVKEEELSFFIGCMLEEFTGMKAIGSKSCQMNHELDYYLNERKNDDSSIEFKPY